MSLKNKIINIVLNVIPILVMIGLIPFIQNDYLLTIVYVGIILISFFVKKEKGDIFIFLFGFFAMILSEMVFISTGVETFIRNTFFNLMPLWLPFLWGYGFVAIKRGLEILMQKNEKTKIGVGVLVFKDNKILLGKRRWRHGDGEYSFPGGHLEYMQSFENCAKQETLEEAGIKIKNIRFLCLANTNLYLPRHEIYIGVIAEWESGETRSLEDERIVDWGWYDLNNLPKPLFKFCEISIEAYKTGKNYFDLR